MYATNPRSLTLATRRKLRTDSSAIGTHPTDLQRAKLLERQNALQRRIDGFRTIQQLFVPGMATILPESGDEGDSCLPQELPLLLPSAACTQIAIPATSMQHEFRLRRAQALDALADLRGHLEVRAYIYGYKDQHVRGQRKGNRSNDVVHSIEGKIKLATSRYHAAFTALTTLSNVLGDHGWRLSLRVLDDSDIRHIAAGDGTGSVGRREISWIWKTSGLNSDGTVLTDQASVNLQEGAYMPFKESRELTLAAGLRVEWCKARARAMRWMEEVELVDEEMRRVKEFYNWQAGWWEAQAAGRQGRLDLLEGTNAYAHRQASIRRSMRDCCVRAWSCVRTWICLGQAAAAEASIDVGDVGSDDDNVPSMYTASNSTASTMSLSAVLGSEAQDIADIQVAIEDFD